MPNGVGLADVLSDVETFVRRFCVLPSDHAYVAVCLWVGHTHAMDAWEYTPRLAVLSAEKESGKTRLTHKVVASLVPNPMEPVSVTASVLYRRLAVERPTVLIDETDTVWGNIPTERSEAVRGIINTGYGRTGNHYRTENFQEKEYPSYCAVALAGLKTLPDTILSRSVIIHMRKRLPSEKVDPWYGRVCIPEGNIIRDALANVFTPDVVNHLSNVHPEPMTEIEDRAWEIWETLVSLADFAGGDWPTKARDAAKWFDKQAKENVAPPSQGIQLLTDIRAVWMTAIAADSDFTKMLTKEIVSRLCKLTESPWGEESFGKKMLTTNKFVALIGEYGIKSKPVRMKTGERGRGFDIEQFSDAWSRYLPPYAVEAVDSVDSVDTARQRLVEPRQGDDLSTLLALTPSEALTPSKPLTRHVNGVNGVNGSGATEAKKAVPKHNCAGTICRTEGCPNSILSKDFEV